MHGIKSLLIRVKHQLPKSAFVECFGVAVYLEFMVLSITKYSQNVFLLLKKEFRVEMRTRYALNGILMFVIVTVALINFSMGFLSIPSQIFYGLMWLALFFSGMYGLSRTFIAEVDQNTSDFLKLLVRPSQIFISKFLFNLLLSFSLTILLILTFYFFFTFPQTDFISFFCGMFLGATALSSTTTLLASIVALSDGKGALFPVLSFPLMIPLVMTLARLTQLSLENAPFALIWEPIAVLISFIVVTLTASILLFDYIWY